MEPMVRVGGPERRMLDFFLLRGGLCWCWLVLVLVLGWPPVRRLRRDFLCASVLDLRSVARMEAVTSGEGGSPNMKNLMKAAISRTTEIWPRMKPCVKEKLRIDQFRVFCIEILPDGETYVGSGRAGHTPDISDMFRMENSAIPLLKSSHVVRHVEVVVCFSGDVVGREQR